MFKRGCHALIWRRLEDWDRQWGFFFLRCDARCFCCKKPIRQQLFVLKQVFKLVEYALNSVKMPSKCFYRFSCHSFWTGQRCCVMPQLVDILLFTVLDPRASRFERRKVLLHVNVGERAGRVPNRLFRQYKTVEAFSERYYVVRVSLLTKSKQRCLRTCGLWSVGRPLVFVSFSFKCVKFRKSRSPLYFNDFPYIVCRLTQYKFPIRMIYFTLSLTLTYFCFQNRCFPPSVRHFLRRISGIFRFRCAVMNEWALVRMRQTLLSL